MARIIYALIDKHDGEASWAAGLLQESVKLIARPSSTVSVIQWFCALAMLAGNALKHDEGIVGAVSISISIPGVAPALAVRAVLHRSSSEVGCARWSLLRSALHLIVTFNVVFLPTRVAAAALSAGIERATADVLLRELGEMLRGGGLVQHVQQDDALDPLDPLDDVDAWPLDAPGIFHALLCIGTLFCESGAPAPPSVIKFAWGALVEIDRLVRSDGEVSDLCSLAVVALHRLVDRAATASDRLSDELSDLSSSITATCVKLCRGRCVDPEDPEDPENENENARYILRNVFLLMSHHIVCDNASCTNLGGPSELALKTERCGGDGCAQRYCSVACQEQDWRRGHKNECPSVRDGGYATTRTEMRASGGACPAGGGGC